MAHRTLIAPAGHAWHVWAVHLTVRAGRAAPAAAFAPGYAEGWLVFERLPASAASGAGALPGALAAEKRRYAPVPPGWDQAPDGALAAWLAAAAVVAPPDDRRRGPARGVTIDDTPAGRAPAVPPA